MWLTLSRYQNTKRIGVVEGPIMGSVVQELQTRLEAAESKITAQEAEIAILKG